jgi:hypothetical protein
MPGRDQRQVPGQGADRGVAQATQDGGGRRPVAAAIPAPNVAAATRSRSTMSW